MRVSEEPMTPREAIVMILAFLIPWGFVILLTRSVLRSSFGERFLKGATPMKKIASLASAVVVIAALMTGCGADHKLRSHLLPGR